MFFNSIRLIPIHLLIPPIPNSQFHPSKMKRLLLPFLFVFSGIAPVLAQTDYKPILQQTLAAFDSVYSYDGRLPLANKLNLIAKKYSSDWVTQYYAAYGQIQLSYLETDGGKKDALLDEADTYLKEAVRLLGKETDETHVLGAMIANARISVDGRARYQKYGKVFEEHLDAAKAINPDNPRMYLVKGISKLYTPKMFGGGRKAALPYFQKAEGLFEKEAPGDLSKPYWGHATNQYMMKQATGEEE